eukprot:5893017-Prymnesium_polylepis.1
MTMSGSARRTRSTRRKRSRERSCRSQRAVFACISRHCAVVAATGERTGAAERPAHSRHSRRFIVPQVARLSSYQSAARPALARREYEEY